MIVALTASPADMNLNPSGLLTWIPSGTQAGSYPVMIQVRAGCETLDQSFTLQVTEAINTDPVFVSEPETGAIACEAYAYQARAEDGDGDPLTFALTKGPEGLTLDPATGRLSWTPLPTQTGVFPVTLRVADGRGGSATRSFDLIVADPINQPPNFTSNRSPRS